MRGRELGLSGQDLMRYQIGEVVQVSVMIEKEVERWVRDTRREVGVPEPKGKGGGFGRLSTEARRLVDQLCRHSPEERDWIREVFVDTLAAMRLRHRVVHDQWVSLDAEKVTRFGFFPSEDGFDAVEIVGGEGAGEYTHEDWERLRTRLWHCWYRLSHLQWVRKLPPEYTYFFSATDGHYSMIRGEVYLGRDFLVPLEWSAFTQAQVDAWPSESDQGSVTP